MVSKPYQTRVPSNASIVAFPMHGQQKLIAEGYRTRDGHLIEWMARKLRGHGPIAVVSRPEPLPLEWLSRVDYSTAVENTIPIRLTSARIPKLRDRRRWWVDSLNAYPSNVGSAGTAAIVWNPMMGISRSRKSLFHPDRKIVFDLLDDWTIHYAFEAIRDDVRHAYQEMFDRADYVTANAEGTLALARRFGREDCILLPNGVDPERFDEASRATGPITVGYVGKIGKRLNLDLIVNTATALPEINFVFAGPILDREYRKPLASLPNVELLGDVHYDNVPALLQEFDIGWVPHNVGGGEVGGDVIKTYEYRAAGLPVLTTPISGARTRGLNSVAVHEQIDHVGWIRDKANSGLRVERVAGNIPEETTWEHKADLIIKSLYPKGI